MKSISKILTNNKLIDFSNIIFAVLMSYFIAELLLVLVTPKQKIITKTIQNETPTNRYQASFIFGKSVIKTATKPVDNLKKEKLVPSENLSLAPIKLNILGLIKTKNPKNSVIFFNDKKTNKKKFVKVGEMIDSNTKLLAVEHNYITVLHHGHKKIVLVNDKKSQKSVQISTNSKQKPSEKQGARISVNLPTNFASKIKDIRKKLKSNPISLMNLFAGIPVVKNGKVQGIKISAGSDKKLFNALQLKSQDIIISVNDIPITDASRIGDLMALIDSTTVLNIYLERDGIKRILTVGLP